MTIRPAISDRIRALNELEAVQLAHALLAAERGRLGLKSDQISIGFNTKAPDGGIDGRTLFPQDAPTAFPDGPRVWQIKSGSTPPNARQEFRQRNGSDTVVSRIGSGEWGYVLFWTSDSTEPSFAEPGAGRIVGSHGHFDSGRSRVECPHCLSSVAVVVFDCSRCLALIWGTVRPQYHCS